MGAFVHTITPAAHFGYSGAYLGYSGEQTDCSCWRCDNKNNINDKTKAFEYFFRHTHVSYNSLKVKKLGKLRLKTHNKRKVNEPSGKNDFDLC